MPQLDAFFHPNSIAVIGGSNRPLSMGALVIENLKSAGYQGRVWAVNRKGYDDVQGYPCVKTMYDIKEHVDLAVICIPQQGILRALKEIASHGTKAAIILTGGIARRLSEGAVYVEKLNEHANKLGIRLLGPNCMGVLVPDEGLNVSFSHVPILRGNTAFIGQSASLGASLLDWAYGQSIGFSHFLTVGERADINASEAIDYLAADRRVKSMLLHVEKIINARRFMTVLRSASRTKNVLAIKTTADEQPAPGLRTRDGLDDAFFARAGVLSVDNMDGLFNGLETLARAKPLYGGKLVIVCNGLGPAILAEQRLKALHGELADTSVIAERFGEAFWYADETGGNPIILRPDADADEIIQVLKKLDQDPQVGGILLIHAPNKRSQSADLAEALAPVIKRLYHSVLTCWTGHATVDAAKELFAEKGLLTYDSPNEAVDAFMTLVAHERNQNLLRQTPSTMELNTRQARQRVRSLVAKVEKSGRDYLTWLEARDVLEAYGLKVIESRFSEQFEPLVDEVYQYPCALRLVHTEACYPFNYPEDPSKRWRGVAIELADSDALQVAGKRLINEKAERFPNSQTLGFAVQPMLRRLDSMQFCMGITRDPVYGPLVLFGEGGSAADILADRQFAFPPLNSELARQLIESSHAWSVLRERSKQLSKDQGYLVGALMRISQMIIDVPTIRLLEVNFLLRPEEGLTALGVSLSLGEPELPVVTPYPQELVSTMEIDGEQLQVRPIRAEDEPQLKQFFDSMTPQDLRFRFFGSRINFQHRELASMCQIDYEREMAFLAFSQSGQVAGEVRTWTDVNYNTMEFSIMVAPAYKGRGLAKALMRRMKNFAAERECDELLAEVMPENRPMRGLAKHFGFSETIEEEAVLLKLPLS
ncbi:bifunctional acetate--CoA ligase family protein/GNAT family N-acetyltransferase [Salinibius halmophilus]|uniref:bifunctional acetate--CoA ligase family protein/GNAT family N-acetyltransferase n=1 Tax=Salinibius halmophilus TaxID=1853216 RepID=UPI000E6618CB|nr:GNAT family N-acetyltransferase [Salinibius halmophilus]